MVYRLRISYVGTRYSGWQRQPNAVTVQQRVEEALSALMGEDVSVHGASRTDAGVHARGQEAHLILDREFPESGLVHGTNHHLPQDIRVLESRRMPDGFHARKSATSKEYSYRLDSASVQSPLDAPFSVQIGPGLNVPALQQCASRLVGSHDFSAFALAGGNHSQPVREIFAADWRETDSTLRLRIKGSGFLRGMVRSLVGTMLEVGRGKMTPEQFGNLLQGGERCEAGPTALARGLTLESVQYPC